MKALGKLLIMLLGATSLFAQQNAPSEAQARQGAAPAKIQADFDAGFLKLNYEMNLGEVLGVAVNSKGNIVVLNHPRHVDNYFNGSTDVTWDAQDNIYVSDGYSNSRIAKFDKHGNWIKAWGSRGTANGQFNTPHNIASDREGTIYVADRGNGRI